MACYEVVFVDDDGVQTSVGAPVPVPAECGPDCNCGKRGVVGDTAAAGAILQTLLPALLAILQPLIKQLLDQLLARILNPTPVVPTPVVPTPTPVPPV